ncbi:MAG TPA: helix-turn-helix transcriptional regulator [Anaerolineales bacterium]|nr:helix-turn-helix transcriptional regulator [Anaerolineales bacterium]
MKKSKEIARRIKLVRTWAGYSQRQLAKKIGVHQTTIAQIEVGNNFPSMDTLLKLAEVLGVKPGELIDGTGIFI